ncbi:MULTISPECIES: DUF6660 family protein [Flavobacteriaceae]|uniref:DUF6660 family protein n=1 Tax=Flavobacteriaceae TaxID=49546 RepID=UPI0027E41001|nr:DUF6660 family protein [Gillisia lutea]
MKIITIILSFYFLALNFTPCVDSKPNSDNTQVEFSQVTDADQEHNDSILCSPFCHCHCCHVHTIDFGLVSFELLQPAIPHQYFAHFDNLGKDIPHFLLHPPRV